VDKARLIEPTFKVVAKMSNLTPAGTCSQSNFVGKGSNMERKQTERSNGYFFQI
jgi:hypothetical protein